ncbi:MAG: hypothetical protein GF331_07835, partial [Chitinivibrionales bacterium]|nr:hypothetical protein [Chitinivibrionales bacterium]
IVRAFAGIDTEYRFVRDTVGVTDFSFMQKYRVPEESGIDFLDSVVAGNVAKIRFGRVLHTFIADDNGMLLADCYVANNDDELVVLCESITDDAGLDAILLSDEGREAGVEKLTESHAAIGIDGFKAWTVAKRLFGADVLGLPYLSLEVYPFEGEDIRLIRAGKTSEFGYLLVAPVETATGLMQAVIESAKANDGGLCGLEVHDHLRLEGRFFNIFAEGERVRDPLQLGLQWMIDFDKDAFGGRDAILQRRSEGLKRKCIGVRTEGPSDALEVGMALFDGATQVAEVVASCHSYVLDVNVGLASFPIDIAYSGLPFTAGGPDGASIRTISMPPIMPKSLTVRLDEL